MKKSALPDDTELKSLKEDDGKAFTRIYHLYFHPLCIYAQKIVEDEDAALDIVQDFFTKFWEDREKIEISISLRAYLYGSVKYFSLKYIEHLHVMREYHDHFLKDHSDFDDRNPISILIGKETEREIERAINALPEQCRKVFELYQEGLSYCEIASKLAVSKNTVDTQIRRAKAKIQDTLIPRKNYKRVYIK